VGLRQREGRTPLQQGVEGLAEAVQVGVWAQRGKGTALLCFVVILRLFFLLTFGGVVGREKGERSG
jgi:hypothetical protein